MGLGSGPGPGSESGSGSGSGSGVRRVRVRFRVRITASPNPWHARVVRRSAPQRPGAFHEDSFHVLLTSLAFRYSLSDQICNLPLFPRRKFIDLRDYVPRCDYSCRNVLY